MRKLNTGDAFKLLQIFRTAGLKDEFAKLLDTVFTKKAKDEDGEEERKTAIGGKLFAILFDCLGHERAEPMVLKLLADISGKRPDEIARQSLQETVELLKEIAKLNDLGSFFGAAAGLT